MRCAYLSCVAKTQPVPVESTSVPQSTTPTLVQTITLDEIWSALEGMAPHSAPHLSESEFLARFQILVQVNNIFDDIKSPFFSRALFLGYLKARA